MPRLSVKPSVQNTREIEKICPRIIEITLSTSSVKNKQAKKKPNNHSVNINKRRQETRVGDQLIPLKSRT